MEDRTPPSSYDDADETKNTSTTSGLVEDVHHCCFLLRCRPLLLRSCLTHHVSTELGFFQCMLTEQTVADIATNSTANAHNKGWPATWQTSAAEIWLFIAVHIYMGIVRLPRAHMYWEDSWQQSFVVDSFGRQRFHELLRFFYIAPPTPAGTCHTVIDKVRHSADLV